MTKMVWNRILELLKGYRHLMVLALLFACLQVVFSLIIPIYTGYAIDQMLGVAQVNFSALVGIISKMAVFTVIAVFAQWGLTLTLNQLSYSIIHRLRCESVDVIEHLPIKTLDERAHGDFISRVVTDVEIISDGLIQGLPQLFSGILTILGTLAFMFSISASITLIVLISTPISMIVASQISKKSYSRFKQQSATRGELTGYANEFLENPMLVRVFSYQEETIHLFSEINQRLYSSGQKAQFYSSLTNPSTRLINNTLYTLIGIIGAISAMNGGMSVGSLSAFLVYSTQFMKPFNEISGVLTELQNALASLQRVIDLLDMKQEIEPEGLHELSAIDGAIDMQDVAFSYTDKPFIEHFSMTIEPKRIVAIVGPTGCGKTTLINLIMRFYEINSGVIRIDDWSLDDISKDSLRHSIGMVLQDSWLFKGTIKENIAYGRPDASDEEIIQVAKETYLHDFILRMKDGYDTVVSEEDTGISQGQKQLLCLARVILSNPPVLILDEATSNIDTRTERAIQVTIDRMMEQKTSIIIAHRLSTIEKADKIIVMKDGRIIETGKHQELLSKHGFYSQLYQAQFENQ